MDIENNIEEELVIVNKDEIEIVEEQGQAGLYSLGDPNGFSAEELEEY